MRPPRISIVVLTFNALYFVKQCLDSIKRFSKDYELIVVDNGSSQETLKWLKEQRDIVKIFNFKNRGFAAGNNQGIKVAKGEYILLLNSDTLATKDWLWRLVRCIERDSKIGIVGPYSNFVKGDQRVATLYASKKEMYDFAKSFNRKEKQTFHIGGFCMLIKRRLLERIGSLDERFKVGNFEDVDYCIRAVRGGFQLSVANCFIHHFGSRSFFDPLNRIDIKEAFGENILRLKEKWPNQDTGKFIPE